MSSSLREFGFVLDEAKRFERLDVRTVRAELLHQIETTAVEVFMDAPVSPPCLYEIGPSGEFMWHGEPMIVDPDERNGATKEGFKRLRDVLMQNPFDAVLFYSPKGPGIFQERPGSNFNGITYTDGQLYMQYYDGRVVHTVAVQVSNEEVAFDIMERFGLKRPQNIDQRALIEYYLLNPITTGTSINGAPASIDQSGLARKMIYKNKYKEVYPLQTVLHIVRQTFAGRWARPGKEIADRIMRDLDHVGPWTERDIEGIYIKAALMYAEITGETEISFMGSCGGRVHSVAELGARLLGHGLQAVNIFSSSYRLESAINETVDYKDDPNLCQCGRPSEPHFHCDGTTDDGQSCEHPIIVGENTTQCPNQKCKKLAVCVVAA